MESIRYTEVQQGTSLTARFKDFTFPTSTPRIFTSNAMNPQQFHSGLPRDPWNATSAQRRGLGAHVKAAFKRACFAVVTEPLVPSDIRESYNKHRRTGDVV